MKNIGINLEVVNQFNSWINDPKNPYIRQIRSILNKYGTVEEINAKARNAKLLSSRMSRLEAIGATEYIEQIKWLERQRDIGSFVSIEEFRKSVLGDDYASSYFPETNAVTLEISSLNYFDWLMEAARQALENRTLLPTRYIVIRPLRDVELARPGELIAIDAALDVMGATHCIQMDTTGKNTGANIHALTTDTMIGWLGGSGMPNEHVLMWIDELLYYYTTYGVDHILNVTPGTMLACSILYRMGINVTMKGSVLMGTDNVYTGIVYLLLTRMFARDDGSVPMLGLNPSDSVNLETMRQLADLRLMLGLENKVRIEQHVTNFYKGVVAQPFVRRDLLVESAKTIPYMSAKHEGADPSIEATLEHPSNNLEFVLPDKEVLAGNHFEHMQQSFLYGVSELNKTAVELTRNKMAFLAASNLHRRY